ncbi:hypothetical protein [Chachezhania sediminis]|uniref:hypothetical protein n=1 Tax=Chachezhania sediminis TaxID=2599291 RepID=UPI00131EBE37|nr:hypothetical protein [Chachezhania sediminis]
MLAAVEAVSTSMACSAIVFLLLSLTGRPRLVAVVWAIYWVAAFAILLIAYTVYSAAALPLSFMLRATATDILHPFAGGTLTAVFVLPVWTMYRLLEWCAQDRSR